MADQTFDILIRTALEGAGLRATDEQVKVLTRDMERLNSVAAKSTTGDVFKGSLAADLSRRVGQEMRQQVVAAVELADQLEDLSGKAGVSAEALQTIGNAASLNGSSIAGAAQAMAFLNRASAAAQAGNEGMIETFGRLGVTLKDLQTSTPDEVLLKIADAVANSTDRSRAYADVLAVAGRESGNLFATLQMGSEAIRKVGTDMGVFSEKTVRELAAAKDALQKFDNQVTVLSGKTLVGLKTAWEKIGTAGVAKQFFENLLNPAVGAVKTFYLLRDAFKEADETIKGAETNRKPFVDPQDIEAAAEAAKKEAAEISRFAGAMAQVQQEIARGIDREDSGKAAEFRVQQQIKIAKAQAEGNTAQAQALEDQLAMKEEYERLMKVGIDDAAKAYDLAVQLVEAKRKAKDEEQGRAQAAKDAASAAQAEAAAAKAAADAKAAFEGLQPKFGDELNARGGRGGRQRNDARTAYEQQARDAARAAFPKAAPSEIDRRVGEKMQDFDQQRADKRGTIRGAGGEASGADVTKGGQFDEFGNRVAKATGDLNATTAKVAPLPDALVQLMNVLGPLGGALVLVATKQAQIEKDVAAVKQIIGK